MPPWSSRCAPHGAASPTPAPATLAAQSGSRQSGSGTPPPATPARSRLALVGGVAAAACGAASAPATPAGVKRKVLRAGNVVKAKADFCFEALHVHRGQLGFVQEVESDGCSKVRFQDQTARVPRKEAQQLEVQTVKHEVELVNQLGQPVGRFLRCIVCRDHCDGFLDIYCQDGQEAEFVHAGFVQQLPPSQFTDVGYSVSARPARSVAMPSSRSKGVKPADPVSLRLAQLFLTEGGGQGQQSGPPSPSAMGYSLPPPGLERQSQRAKGGFFAAGAALHAARSAKALRPEAAVELALATAAEASAQEGGPQTSLCPFMEIQEGGLCALVAQCSFTSRDVVFDLGCGKGKILRRILASFPCWGIGVDVNFALVRHAAQQLQRFGHRAQLLVDDVRNIDMEQATATVSFFVPHSFDAQGASLKEHLSKTLRAGCVVLNYTFPIPGWQGSCTNGWHKYVMGVTN